MTTHIPEGPRGRRGRDVMVLLAAARPASLDPAPEPDGRASRLAAGLAAAEPIDAGLAAPGHGVRARGVTPGENRARGLRAGPMWAGAGLAVIAGAAAVAVLIAMSGTSAPPARPGAGDSRPAPAAVPSARAILLSAAFNAAKAASAGRYWRVEMISGGASAAGPNAHPYAVTQRWLPSVTWDARSPSQRSWTLPAAGYTTAPATAGARAAWRADGSRPLPAMHSAQQAWWQSGGGVGYFGNSSPTFAQFQALPSSPSALAAVVRAAAAKQAQNAVQGSGWHYTGAGPGFSQDVSTIYVQLLEWDPITPQVRAAVFRDLAARPGVRSVGRVTDPLGRSGFGIALNSPTALAGQEEILVIEPGTGTLLADEYVAAGGPAAPGAASGAVPGRATCPAGTVSGVKAHACLYGVRVNRVNGHLKITVIKGDNRHIGMVRLGPKLTLSAGQAVAFDAVVSAGWTNAAPKLPPLSQQFSVATDGKG